MNPKKLLLTICLLLCGVIGASGQTTAVTATVVDTDGVTWFGTPSGGTWAISFVPNPSYPNPAVYNINGTPLNPTVMNQGGTLSNAGVFNVSVYQNAVVTPIGSQWQLKVCPLASSPCGIYTFQAAGANMDLSASLTPILPKPRFNAIAGSYGYTDNEAVITIPAGGTYWNVTSNSQRYWTGTTWISGGGGGGGGGSPGGSSTNVQSNLSGAFYGDANFTYIPSPNPTVTLGNGTKLYNFASAGPNTVTAGPQSTIPTSWIFDWTSPGSALSSIGGFPSTTMTVEADNLDDILNVPTDWKNPCFLPSCNPGGVDSPASTSQTINNPVPSRDGESMNIQLTTLSISTQTNVLWVNHTTPTCDGCTDMYPDFWYYVPSVNCGACATSFEFDSAIFDKSEGWDFMWGNQCNQVNGFWQIENQGDLPWTNTPVSCSVTYDTWHHFQAHFYRILGDLSCTSPASAPVPCQHWDYYILDGVKYPLNMTMRAMVLNPTFASSTIIQFQLDVGATVTAKTVNMFLDNVTQKATGPVQYMPLSGGNFQGPVTSTFGWNGLLMNYYSSANNVDLGGGLMPKTATGIQNTGIGRGVFNALTTGNSNIAAGVGALFNVTTGGSNAAYGVNALNANVTGAGNTAIGIGALDVTTVGGNTAVGNNSCGDTTTGTGNVCVGQSAGVNGGTPLATGAGNVFVGQNASATSDLSDIIVIGHNASATAAHTATIGTNSILTTILNGNVTATTFNGAKVSAPGSGVAIAAGSIPLTSTGTNNTAVGIGSLLANTSGSSNTAVGLNALTADTTGFNNTAVGVGSQVAMTTGNGNTSIGQNSLNQLTTGTQNTALGLGAGVNSGTPNQTGLNSTFVGENANASVDGLNNVIVMGWNAQGIKNNSVMIGNSLITEACFGAGKFCWYTGNTAPSSALCTSTDLGSIYSNTAGGTNTMYVCSANSIWTPIITSPVTTSPAVNWSNEFATVNGDSSTATIGAAAGNTFTSVNTNQDASHNGVVQLASGTGGTGTGEAVRNGASTTISTTNPYMWTGIVAPGVLPGTTAAMYLAGLPVTGTTVPWVNGPAHFSLSSTNAVVNDWYCQLPNAAGSALTSSTDSGVAATAGGWQKLQISFDGTNIHWYIGGTEVCGTGTAVQYVSGFTGFGAFASVAQSGTSVNLFVDYSSMYRVVVR